MVKYLKKDMAYVFYKLQICFFLTCVKKTAHMLVWGHKNVKAQGREDHVATRLPGLQNLAHTSKTRQVKRTQMFVTAKIRIRVFVTFSDR